MFLEGESPTLRSICGYMTSDWICKGLFHLLLILLEKIQKNSYLSRHWGQRNSLGYSSFTKCKCQNFCLCILMNRKKSSKFLFNEQAPKWKKEDFSFWQNFNDQMWSISKNLEFITFAESIFCSGEELLNWLNKSAKSGGGFNRTELFLLEFSVSFFLSTEEVKSLSIKFPNGRIVLQYLNKTKDQLIL